MTTYKEIFGKPVKHLSTDPTDAEATGQVWYNTTSGTYKSIVSSGAWSSSAPMITARNQSSGGGIQTAAIVFAGLIGPGSPNKTALTEEYNGSGFSVGGALNTARYDLGGTGLQTAALAVGGYDGTSNLAIVEEYDGSTWSEQTNIPAGLKSQALFGIQTAAVMAAGSPALTTCFKYDGSSWTATGALSTGRDTAAKGSGIQTAGLCVGGQVPAVTNATEEFDGSSWTTGGDLNTARRGAYGGGIQTSSLIAGGSIPPSPGSTATELYDGTSWTTSSATMGTASYFGGSASNSPNNTAGLAMGGWKTANSGGTEEYNVSINTITAAAWAAGGNLGTARGKAGGTLSQASTQSAGLAFGGQIAPGVTTLTEEYDGASWTAGGALPTALRWHYGAGTQTAALCAAGVAAAAATPIPTASSEYNGTAWTGGGAVGTGRYNGGSAGSQTAGLIFGGSPAPGYTNATEEYNGSSWTAGGTLATARGYEGGGGTQTAALYIPTQSKGLPTEEYNGSSWSAGGAATNTSLSQTAVVGIQTAALTYGGGSGKTEFYDGATWSNYPQLGTARYAPAGASGTATAAMNTGGGTPAPAYVTATEEFSAATSAINVSTLTTS